MTGAPADRTRLPPVFVGHDIYRRAAYGANHPLAIPRVETVLDLCCDLGWIVPDAWIESPVADAQTLCRFHDPDYVAALCRADEDSEIDRETCRRFNLGTLENPVFPGVYRRASTSVGGSVEAAEQALSGRIAYHPAGGTHHGRPDRASGFCYFNDPVFAILTALDAGVGRLVHADLDAHHGDGVQDAFAADPRVYTISIHERDRWPHTGALDDTGGGQSCNLPVAPGFADADLALLLNDVILPLVRRAAPELIVVTCGADGLAGDPLSRMSLSNRGLWAAVAALVAEAPGSVVLGGGGYNPWTVARCWAGLWGVLNGFALPETLDPASVRRLEALDCDLVDEDERDPRWLTTLADEPQDGAARPETATLARRALAIPRRGRWSAGVQRAAA
ncbi:MAG: acetoin utilization protein AcuC [Rhodospirillaceae bacterium]|nr:acetoin utilization protein AcuC [Rhodospirillaceae bacterium]MDE0618954.1 acetoin utilization protein AcuC [Rhodospirillaceae bacterium]